MYSTHFVMLGYCTSSTRVSPYIRYIVQGMITAASAQPAEPAAGLSGLLRTSGITNGTLPFGSDVLQPLREEPRDVHVEGSGRREGLRVARPPKALIALRAIGRHIHEVALLPPLDVVLQ